MQQYRTWATIIGLSLLVGCGTANRVNDFLVAEGRYTSVAQDMAAFRADHPDRRDDPMFRTEAETYRLSLLARSSNYNAKEVADFQRSVQSLEVQTINAGVANYAANHPRAH